MNDHPPTPDRPTDTRRSSVRVVVVSAVALTVLLTVVTSIVVAGGLAARQGTTDNACLDTTTQFDVVESQPLVVKALYCSPDKVRARSQRSASQQSLVVVRSSSHQSSHGSVQSSSISVQQEATVQRGDDGGADRQSHVSAGDSRSSVAPDVTWGNERVRGEHIGEACVTPRHAARASHVHSTVGGVSILLDREQVRALLTEVLDTTCPTRDPLFEFGSVRETTVDTVGVSEPWVQRPLEEQQHDILRELFRSADVRNRPTS